MAGDILIAVLVLLVDVAFFLIVSNAPNGDISPWYVTLPIDVATVAPLIVRRKYPLPAAYAVLIMGALHAALELGTAAAVASCIFVYSVVVYVSRRAGVVYLVLMLAATITQLQIQVREQWVTDSVVAGLLLILCWGFGEFVSARRAYQAEVEARLHLLETEQDHATKIAVAEERARIARELHDVVAHAVSVIVVHADGASYAIGSNPELARTAVRTISETGRGALAELRRLLDVLRDDRPDERPRVPQPTAGDLTDLAERMRTAGLPVELDVDADFAELPAGVSLGVYRIVQESLTNTLKHAGNGARAKVSVHVAGERIAVDISDDGAGKARPVVPGSRTFPGGNGVIGMRERASVYGGTLRIGPTPGGGWKVSARLPVRLDQ
ncbi:two-component sensor histidine kinase [Prauserella marina]|nr:histidine kinase [Prauserella marina]ASR39845.1 two-component sensor histidine kinase [Prauserella marina]